jgi:four helix bundle protein
MNRFEDLLVWRKSRELANMVYELSKRGPFVRDFGLRDQMRRAAVSVMSNIAEGYERRSDAEFRQFLKVAKGSCGEVRCQLYVAHDQGYLDKATFDHALACAYEVSRMLQGLSTRVGAGAKPAVKL